MPGKRKYYNRLVRIFLIIAAVIFTITVTFTVLHSRKSIISRNNALIATIAAQNQQTTNMMGFISNTIDTLYRNNELIIWSECEAETPEYYYSSVRLFDTIQRSSPLLEYLDYDVSVTTSDPAFFVVTSEGTISKYLFAASHEGLDETLPEGIYPSYGTDGQITEVLIVTSRSIDGRKLIFLVNVPASTFRSGDPGIGYSLHDTIRDVTFSVDMEKVNHIAASSAFPSLGFSIEYGFDFMSYGILLLAIAFLVPLLLTVLALVFHHMTTTLYRPVNEALSSLDASGNDYVDEFKLITDGCRNISRLTEELSKELEARTQLAEQQKYRALLRGVPTQVKEDDGNAFFALATAIAHTQVGNENTIFASLELIALEFPHVHCIRTEIDEEVIVCKNEDRNKADEYLKEVISKCTEKLSDSNVVRFAFISASQGYESVKTSFRKARELMEYRFRINNRIMLIESDFPQAQQLMNYPFSDERRLINAVLASSDEAVTIFDEIVTSNLSERQLSPQELQRFCFALNGTVLRIFQELKETPEELLGSPIDWHMMFNESSRADMIPEIREIILKTVKVKQHQDEIEDDLVVTRMKEYISSHYNENLMLIDLSNEFNLTPKYCSSIFKKFSNDTFKNYLNELRIHKACQLIEEDPTIRISDLATMVGFTSSNTFIRVFGKYTGVTPGAYAEKFRQNQE